MNTYKHSGTLGDIIYALPIMKKTGGGAFYLHLHQVDWIGKHFYGAEPSPFHKGRMTMGDFNFLKDFFLEQSYITKCEPLDPKTAEITHNLDKFRPVFVGHPGNYVDIYAGLFGFNSPEEKKELRTTPWLTVPNKRTFEGRDIMINRTQRWVPSEANPCWANWKDAGWDTRSFFVGLPDEYEHFKKITEWDIPYQPVKTLLEMAEYIAGAETFIGNQSVAFSVAVGLGHPDIYCEARRDLPIERNECYFPYQTGLHYF